MGVEAVTDGLQLWWTWHTHAVRGAWFQGRLYEPSWRAWHSVFGMLTVSWHGDDRTVVVVEAPRLGRLTLPSAALPAVRLVDALPQVELLIRAWAGAVLTTDACGR